MYEPIPPATVAQTIPNLGFGDNEEKTLDDYIKALKDAGISKVTFECIHEN